ncbi:MAG TPA: hypothetical protein VGH86_12310 [Phenylobacterium sp.]
MSDSWKLSAPHDANVQGLVVSPFRHLESGEALLLQLPLSGGGAWLDALLAKIPITDATGRSTPSAALAFTWTGLEASGLDEESLTSFSQPFIEGMRQIDRQRRLGDDEATIVEGGPLWSGNAPDAYAPPGATVAEPTATTVHAALLLYHTDGKSLEGLTAAAEEILKPHGVKIVRRIGLSLMLQNQQPREHFGFVDGVSQPVPYGSTIVTVPGSPKVDPRHGIPAGDILLGHPDGNGEPVPGPLTPDQPAAAVLPNNPAAPGYRDLGLDGTYLVLRELRQNVAAFWDSMKAAAAALGHPERDEKWVAARVIGRTLDGDPLCPDGTLEREGGNPANAFGYARDHKGLGCPLGSHMRRANPRDGLAPTPADRKGFLQASNNHRILRRGRKYGPLHSEKPEAERGLLFMAINTDIARQFEFIQQSWMFNSNFATLYDETDPLMGPRGPFTLPGQPLRTRVGVETYVRLVGGDYFFLPSLPALAYLAKLR